MAIKFKRGTAEKAAASEEVLEAGQPFLETTNHNLYVGDGSTQIKNLKKGLVTGEYDTVGDQYPRRIRLIGDPNSSYIQIGGERQTSDDLVLSVDGISPVGGSDAVAYWPTSSDISNAGSDPRLALRGYVDSEFNKTFSLSVGYWTNGSDDPTTFMSNIPTLPSEGLKVGDRIILEDTDLTSWSVEQDTSRGTTLVLTVSANDGTYVSCVGQLEGWGNVTAQIQIASPHIIFLFLDGSVRCGFTMTMSDTEITVYLEMLLKYKYNGLYPQLVTAIKNQDLSPFYSAIQSYNTRKSAIVLSPHSYYISSSGTYSPLILLRGISEYQAQVMTASGSYISIDINTNIGSFTESSPLLGVTPEHSPNSGI